MNITLKQRLVGAVVLVALAVIFLPMILDGAGTSDDIAREVRIPDRPETPEADLDAVPEPVPPADEPDSGITDPVTEAAPEVPEAEPEPEPRVETDPAPVTDESAATDDVEVAADDGMAEAPQVWAVQTGSFTRQDNAIAQRDRLHEAGFDAFIDEADADGGQMWRVRVGPIAREDEARELRGRLEAEEGLAGIVVSHP